MLRASALAALAAGAAPLAGCDLFDDKPKRAAAPDPLAPLITEALDLAARYEAVVAGDPQLADRLTPVAQAHRAHAAELARVTGSKLPSATPGPSTTPVPAGDVAATLAELRGAEGRGRDAAVRACVAAPANRAALVGSIAAARATHVEVLR